VPDDAVFPYVCFKFTSTDFNVRTRADRILEIDFWNNSNDDSKLLELLDRVKNGNGLVKGLNYSIQDELEGFYKAYIEFEGEIQTNETEIIRHNQRYIVKCD
jgi:hypothetical protein